MAIIPPGLKASSFSSIQSLPSETPQLAAPLLDSNGSPIVVITPPDLVKRDPQPAETTSPFGATKSCGPNDSRAICQRPVSGTSSTTLPIVLGTVIPLTVAIVMFAVLHRRHVRKQRQEDANDKHKSLDFGMGDVEAPMPKRGKKSQKAKGVPQMSLADTEKTLGRRQHMLSMDMDMTLSSPYMLPPELQQSRESLHSLSRTMNHEDDKYRTAMSFHPGDASRSQQGSRMGDDSSIFTASTRHGHGDKDLESNASLLRHAQRMSRSMPPTRKSSFSSVHSGPALQYPQKAKLGSTSRSPSPPSKPLATERFSKDRSSKEKFLNDTSAPNRSSPHGQTLAPIPSQQHRESYLSDISKDGNTVGMRKSNDYLGAFIRSGGVTLTEPKQITATESKSGAVDEPKPIVVTEKAPSSPPKEKATLTRESATLLKLEANSPLKFDFPDFVKENNKAPVQQIEHTSTQPVIHVATDEVNQAQGNHAYDQDRSEQDQHVYGQGQQEQGKHVYDQELEYDERRLTVLGMRPLPPDDDPTEDPEHRANRIRSFYKEYFDETKQTPASGPDDYSGGVDNGGNPGYFDYSENYYGRASPQAQPWTRRAMTPQSRGHASFQPQHRMAASSSGGQFSAYNAPRAYSSASGRFGGPPGLPKKKGPPPSPLTVLPTPHLLKDDTMLPIDFAPPSSIRAQRSGTPDSLRGGRRPYSPALPAHLPLAGSYDDLAAMPSPHALRKSSTFTALDFAPPPRFRSNTDSRSDAGSIRSNRSGMSQAQIQSIRAGAYRVSRIPGELGGTRQEFADSLKPSWDMRK